MRKSIPLQTKALQKRETPDILTLVRHAEAGDRGAITALRSLMNRTPGAWERAGNLAIRAENALIDVAAGKDEILREALTKKLAALKEELGGAAPLERLLVERVVSCWLNVYYIDALYAERLNDVTAEQGEYFQRRQERAHRLYLSAIRTLAQVRRLLVPAVQVNIGAQQVNVAQKTRTPNSLARRNCPSGVDVRSVQRALGHSSVAVTERFYGRWCRNQQNNLDETLKSALGNVP